MSNWQASVTKLFSVPVVFHLNTHAKDNHWLSSQSALVINTFAHCNKHRSIVINKCVVSSASYENFTTSMLMSTKENN